MQHFATIYTPQLNTLPPASSIFKYISLHLYKDIFVIQMLLECVLTSIHQVVLLFHK